jgi:hypothetical protein
MMTTTKHWKDDFIQLAYTTVVDIELQNTDYDTLKVFFVWKFAPRKKMRCLW